MKHRVRIRVPGWRRALRILEDLVDNLAGLTTAANNLTASVDAAVAAFGNVPVSQQPEIDALAAQVQGDADRLTAATPPPS